MTRRLRIYRGIAVLASLAAMGPQMAACDEGPSSSSSKISSRFSNSLEQAAPSSIVEEERKEISTELTGLIKDIRLIRDTELNKRVSLIGWITDMLSKLTNKEK